MFGSMIEIKQKSNIGGRHSHLKIVGKIKGGASVSSNKVSE